MGKEVGKLEGEALKRKERLKNLKRKFDGLSNEEENATTKDENKVEIPK